MNLQKIKLTAIAICAMAAISCEEETLTIGNSLTENSDRLEITTGHFQATTRSINVDSVYSHSRNFYLGRVMDPETGTYVKSEFMTQLCMLSSFMQYVPDSNKIVGKYNGAVCADSCIITCYVNRSKSFGDTLTSLKLRLFELDKLASGNDRFYSNFDPHEEGLVRENGLRHEVMFTLRDLTLTDSMRNAIKKATIETSNPDIVDIRLNKPYTAANGVTYNNYGTYLLRQYYHHPEYFKNSYTFTKNVCPGFNFEIADGLGLLAKFSGVSLYVFYREQTDSTVAHKVFSAAGTEEVLQTAHITNSEEAINRLVEDKSCTYLKTPSGIFTEVTLPVEEITALHPTDSLLSTSIRFTRQNAEELSKHTLNAPTYLMLIQKDSLKTFFENNRATDNRYAFYTTLTTNNYSFSNIGNLITKMKQDRAKGLASDPEWQKKHPDWNKALLVPIELVTTTSGTTTNVIGMNHQMGLTSTRLVGGDTPISIEVIYARFKDQ
ncbi:MAG: DUF4270 domain-containing protein [Prevotella sp.]|nr:DUF4270 domain-containing protein [Prevotella sp.]